MVVAMLSLVVSLGGTGYAISRIDGKDLKPASVSGGKLKKNTLGGREVRESKLATVPTAAKASVADKATTADSATSAVNATTATHASVADSALALDDAAVAGLTIARSGSDDDGVCHPDNTAEKPFLDCASVTMRLPRAGRVLLVGTGGVGISAGGPPYVASCRLEADDAEVAGSLVHGGLDADASPGAHFASTPFGIASTAVTAALSSGSHTFAFACNQADPDAVVADAKISAALLGAG